MCVDGNSAPLSIRYLNSQLSALWQNAKDCVHWAEHHHGEHHSVNLSSEDYVRHKYQRALAQFHYAGAQQSRVAVQHEDLFFSAAFGKPRLEFICNHEAVLYIKIEKGHLNKAYERSKSTHKRLERSDNVAIEGLEVAFRMKFSQSSLEGSDARIAGGNGYQIQLMILNFDAAKLALFRSSLGSDIKVALEFYLHQYLAHLNAAGQNCLLNIPDFDDDAYSPVIDYSLTTRAIEEDLSTDITVHGTSVSAINTHLRSAWLKVASLGELPGDKLSVCLAEIKTQWLQGTESHYHIRFGPPTIKALCDQEVIVYYNIEELTVYESADFSIELQTLKDFSIAFIVNVVESKTESGTATFKLDIETARYCRHLSVFKSLGQEIIKKYVKSIVEFVETTYLDIIVEYDLTVIYVDEPIYVPPSPSPDLPIDGPDHHHHGHSHGHEGPVVPGSGHHGHRDVLIIEEDVLQSFEQVLTITEETVNIVLKTLWATAKKSTHVDVLYKWSVEKRFTATFEQPRVQLLSGGKALVWITLASGSLHVDGHSETSVAGWRLAFEVNLKQVKHSELHVDKSWSGRFKDALFGKTQEESTTIEHVVLDFDAAVYVHELSSFEGVFDSGATAAVLKMRAIKEHMRAYLKAFAYAGYHIVHSTPVYSGVTETRITSTTFQVVSKTTITVKNVIHAHEPAVIVVCGATHGRPLPVNVKIKWSVTLMSKSSNTVCLGREVFLEHLLARLSIVNKQTTIVSRYPTANEEEWRVYLTSWAEHSHRQKLDCVWKQVASSGLTDTLEFQWEHHEHNSYERHGSFEADKSYNLDCRTVNKLFVPTTFRRGGMDIILKGDTQIRIAGQDVAQKWSKHSSATWQATIHVTSEWDGLHVALAHAVKPSIGKAEEVGHAVIDFNAQQLLAAHMPAVISMDAVLAELRATLEGTYKYAAAGVCKYAMYSPVFNVHGDLLLQLRPYDPAAKPPPPPPAPKIVDVPTSPTGGSRSASRGPGPQPRPVPATKRSSWLRRKVDTAIDVIHDVVHKDDERRSVRRSDSQKSLGTPVLESPKVAKSLAGTPILEEPANGRAHAHRAASIASVDSANGHANGKANGKAAADKTIVVESIALPSPKTL